MQLIAPCRGLNFKTTDIYGDTFQLRDLLGKRIMLSFFRDAACPFCNLRIYQLTHQYKDWQKAGLEIVAVFTSPADEVRAHVAKHPRPFRMISDPDLEIYNQYGIQKSYAALFKAIFFKMPTIFKGIKTGGRPRPNPRVNIVPADFLLDNRGQVVELYYGRDVADHIPMERIQSFVETAKNDRLTLAKQKIQQLLKENNKLKEMLGMDQKDSALGSNRNT